MEASFRGTSSSSCLLTPTPEDHDGLNGSGGVRTRMKSEQKRPVSNRSFHCRRDRLGHVWQLTLLLALFQLLLSPGLSYTIHTSHRRSPLPSFPIQRTPGHVAIQRSSSSRLSATPSNNNNDPATFTALLSALALYKAAYQNVNTVPANFIVPNLAPWPEAAHGMALGQAVQEWQADSNRLSPAQTKALQQLGLELKVAPSQPKAAKPKLTWSLLVSAVEMYQTQQLTNRIPIDFVVPSTWEPAAIQGLPLGAQVRALGQNPAFAERVAQLGVIVVEKHQVLAPIEDETEEDLLAEEEGEEALPELEVTVPTPKAPTASVEVDRKSSQDDWSSDEEDDDAPAVEAIRSEEGDEEAMAAGEEEMEPTAVAPLAPKSSGTINVPNVQSLIDNHQGRLSANDKRFYMVYAALSNYRKLYGDLMVPQPFVVPSQTNRWPEELWGIRLGARVNAIRSQGTFVNNYPDRRGLLDALGFIWSPPKVGDRRGRVLSPSRFGEDDNDGDDGLDGKSKAAGALESIFGGSFDFGPGSSDFMRGMGGADGTDATPPSTSWDLDSAKVPESARRSVEEKEKAQRRSEEYVPPRTLRESLDEATERALEVGIISGLTENKRVIKGKRVKNIPWYNDDFGDDFVFEDVVEALTFYKKLHGDFSNFTADCDFVVPVREQVTGFLEQDQRDEIDFFDMDEEMPAAFAGGGRTGESTLNDEDFITAEIQRLQREVGQGGYDGLMPPEGEGSAGLASDGNDSKSGDDSEWPEHLGGMALGHIVRRIKDGSLEVKHLPERKKVLDDIDFDWGDPLRFLDIPFEKALCAFYAYYLVRGDMFVEEDFVMPGDDPWPEVLAGYEIGKAVKRVRELQNFFEAYHPEKLSVLRRIDFLWFTETMALPIDPNEEAASKETIFLTAFGHPDYAKMRYSSMPLELPNQIDADGPYAEIEDPRQWWREWHNWDYVKDIWYANGRRDNAYALRKMGYPKLAAEHEAKYGPGLFQQINVTMSGLREKGVDRLDDEEKRDVVETLSHYRHELTNCTDLDPDTLEALILDIEKHENATKLGVPVDQLGKEGEDSKEAVAADDYDEEEVEDDYEEDEVDDSVEEEEVEDQDEEDDDEEPLTDVNAALGL